MEKIHLYIIEVEGIKVLATDSMTGVHALMRLSIQLPEEYDFEFGSQCVIKEYEPGKVEAHIEEYLNPDVIEVYDLI